MDIGLPDQNGLDTLMAIRSEFSDARIMVLTTFECDAEIQYARKACAQGYPLKSMPAQQMIETIRQVHSGRKSVPVEIAARLAELLATKSSASDRHSARSNPAVNLPAQHTF